MSNSPFISNCTADAIRDAALALKAGHLVAFPTETVYGLGADARNPEAIKRIYEVKGRPTDHPLIVHISSLNQLDKWAVDIPEYAIKLARKFWPGPMTLILKRSEIAGDFITGGQETVGLRVPSDPIALALIQEFEKISESAIAAPSANRFGQVSPTSSADVQEELGAYLLDADQILDGGNSTIGIESTIIDCRDSSPIILRPGAITESMIDPLITLKRKPPGEHEIRVSGNLENHYAPKAKVILNTIPKSGQAFIAMSEILTPSGVFRLLSPNTLEEFAHDIYAALRKADDLGYKEIVIMTPQEIGIGIATNDRLLKAAFKPLL
jgi:L-threonylcarbamoyladenylate synthase